MKKLIFGLALMFFVLPLHADNDESPGESWLGILTNCSWDNMKPKIRSAPHCGEDGAGGPLGCKMKNYCVGDITCWNTPKGVITFEEEFGDEGDPESGDYFNANIICWEDDCSDIATCTTASFSNVPIKRAEFSDKKRGSGRKTN